jgi:hypothetical protein
MSANNSGASYSPFLLDGTPLPGATGAAGPAAAQTDEQRPRVPARQAAQQAAQPAAPVRSIIVTPPDAGHGYYAIWQFELDWNSWADYEPDFAVQLENHYKAHTAAPLRARPGEHGVEFEYSTTEWYQLNTRSLKKRQIRRLIIPQAEFSAQETIKPILKEWNGVHHEARRGLPPVEARSRSGSRGRPSRSSTPSRAPRS